MQDLGPAAPERAFRLRIAYDGAELVGWQRQRLGRSVQGEIEDALARLAGARVTVTGAGRTDAGVHATGQVASVRLALTMNPARLRRALNGILPGDIRVLEVHEVPPSFHARYTARAKVYEYRVLNAAILPPALRGICWHVPQRLDLDAMRGEAAAVVGEHDFTAFRSARTTVKTSVRRVLSSRLDVLPLDAPGETVTLVPMPRLAEGRLLIYTVRGTGFLRYMVRAIVGTIVEVGAGALPPGTVARLLEHRAARAEAGVTAPAPGLCLAGVEYDGPREVAAHR